MVDIETLGQSHESAIISIGAVKFGPDPDGVSDDTFYRKVDPADCQEKGLSIDAATLVWWLQNNPTEAAEVIPGGSPLGHALGEFSAWYADSEAIWAKSPVFDCSILETAYERCDMDPPWEFWETRDVRTLMSLDDAVDTGHSGTAHDALDDAVAQAENIANTLAEVND